MKNLIHLSVLAFLISALMATPAAAAIWYILPDGSGDAPTIQAGLDACAENDTVLVAAGTFYENLIWPATQGIVLTSESGPEATIIDGNAAGRVIGMAGPLDASTTISYLTIRNGYLKGDLLEGSAAGIGCEQNASPTIMGNVITANRIRGNTISGAGIGCGSSTAMIIENTITHNTIEAGSSAASGAGIFCNYQPVTIVGNTIAYNTIEPGVTNSGGVGIHFYECSPLIAENTITDNNGGENGGGIAWGIDSTPIVRDNIIEQNHSDLTGGGIYVEDGGAGIVTGNTIANNTSANGAGIYLNSSHPTISDNLITENVASEKGGGVCCSDTDAVASAGSATIYHNEITSNTSPPNTGGGIHLDGASPLIERCNIQDNGIGIYCETSSEDVSDPVIRNNSIHENLDFGLVNMNSEIEVDAILNWWGHSSGPYNADQNPGGLGDAVSDYVAFDPWLTDLVGVEPGSMPPVVVHLGNHPNPFNPQTKITFALDRPQKAEIAVYDLSGQLVDVLANRIYEAGDHSVVWDGRDDLTRVVPSGTYVVRLSTETAIQARKVMLVR